MADDAAPRRLTPGRVTLAELERLMIGGQPIELDPACWSGVEAAAAWIAEAARGNAPVYGVNTGFGKLARTRIPADRIEELQRRLVLSHMAGLGPPLPDGVVRLLLALKALSLALGRSGVRRATVEALVALQNADALPVIPAKGSAGASGDLAPLAHLSGCLIGLGELRLTGGETVPAGEALRRIGLRPLTLGPKEGLALLNGTQVSTALALAGLFAARRVFDAAVVAGALSVDAALGSDVPFDPRIQVARNQPGQIEVAGRLHDLLAGSGIRGSHLACDRVQDPYSLRCQPQVMGACLELLDEAGAVLAREANGVSDNPLVFAEDNAVLSGGNFHAEPVGFAAERIALALAEIGALSERRTALLVDPSLSSLPAFLIPEPGLNSGFMLPQIVAASLVTENKHLAAPATVDSLPTSANQEDHVSMATYAARRLLEMAENAASIVAIELLAAAQGVELRRPLRSSPALERVHGEIRRFSAFVAEDRPLAGEIAAVARWVLDGGLRHDVADSGI